MSEEFIEQIKELEIKLGIAENNLEVANKRIKELEKSIDDNVYDIKQSIDNLLNNI